LLASLSIFSIPTLTLILSSHSPSFSTDISTFKIFFSLRFTTKLVDLWYFQNFSAIICWTGRSFHLFS
jgi:hypothetical protein